MTRESCKMNSEKNRQYQTSPRPNTFRNKMSQLQGTIIQKLQICLVWRLCTATCVWFDNFVLGNISLPYPRQHLRWRRNLCSVAQGKLVSHNLFSVGTFMVRSWYYHSFIRGTAVRGRCDHIHSLYRVDVISYVDGVIPDSLHCTVIFIWADFMFVFVH